MINARVDKQDDARGCSFFKEFSPWFLRTSYWPSLLKLD